jgi:hypothetical protein
MNKKPIDKDLLLDNLYKHLTESKNHVNYSNSKMMNFIIYQAKKQEYRFFANTEKNKLEIYTYSLNNDNFQTHHNGVKTASLLELPRPVYDFIEDLTTGLI